MAQRARYKRARTGKAKGAPSSQALKQVAGGSYQRDEQDLASFTSVNGTEFEIEHLSAICATTASKDEVYPWVSFTWVIGRENHSFIYEWMIIRCKSADSLQNMNDNDTMEYLHKENRILRRGVVSAGEYTINAVRVHTEVINQIKIPYSEELRFVVRPIYGAGSLTMGHSIMEWRQVGV